MKNFIEKPMSHRLTESIPRFSPNFIGREAIAVSVFPSLKAEIPTPDPPPTRVIEISD